MAIMVTPFWFIQIFLLPETLRSLVGNGSIYANPTPYQAWKKYQANKAKSDQQQQQQQEKGGKQKEDIATSYITTTTTALSKPNNKTECNITFYSTKTAPYCNCNDKERYAKSSAASCLNTNKDGRNSHVSNATHSNRFFAMIPNPLQSLIYLKEKDIAVLLLYNSLQYAGLYSVLTSITELFTNTYGLNEFQIGLCFLSNGFGASIGSFTAGRLLNWKFKRIMQSLDTDEECSRR